MQSMLYGCCKQTSSWTLTKKGGHKSEVKEGCGTKENLHFSIGEKVMS